MSNPFKLYSGQSKNFTRKFNQEWKSFCAKIRKLQDEHRTDGASDTVSREEQVEWIKKHADEVE